MPYLSSDHVIRLRGDLSAFLRIRAGVGRVPPEDAAPERLRKQARHLERKNEELSAKLDELRGDLGIPFDGTVLPPRDARPCGPTHKDDAYYLKTAEDHASMLMEKLGVGPGKSLLDVGCGPGRIAIGFVRQLGDDLYYEGLDVVERSIRWANENITSAHPTYRFSRLNLKNERYNPRGVALQEGFRFPFPDESFDFVVLFSVFTHMMPPDVRTYLRDFRRVLKPGGRILATAFVEDGVPDMEENPPGYLGQEWSGALHCVRYERAFFGHMVEECGLRLDWEDPEHHLNQRHLYFSRP